MSTIMLRRTGLIAMLIAVLAAAHAAPNPQAGNVPPATPTVTPKAVAKTPAVKTPAAVISSTKAMAAPAPARATTPVVKTAVAGKPAATAASPTGTKKAAKGTPAKPALKVALAKEKPGATESDSKADPSKNRRDPFVSIVQERPASTPACSIGKKCLQIGQVILKGVVTSANGMIALVENSTRKSYFLRVNDPVFNGDVVKITKDSIVFRERLTDRLGRVSTREVVKHLPGPKPV